MGYILKLEAAFPGVQDAMRSEPRPMNTPRKKPSPVRRILRVTAEAPGGEFVDIDLTEQAADASADTPARVLDPAPVADWRGSSWDLLNGLEVRDHSDTIPGALFDKIFKR